MNELISSTKNALSTENHLQKMNAKQVQISRILEHFNLNEKQANFVYEKFLKEYKSTKEFNRFYRYYLDSLLDEKIVGTSFEKLLIIARKAEIELIGRYANKEIFIKWLEKRYKNKSFFRVYEKDFTYNAYAQMYDRSINDYTTISYEDFCDEFIVAFNEFGNLIKINKLQKIEMIENGEFKETLLNYIFKHQNRLELDLNKPFQTLTFIKTKEEYINDQDFFHKRDELCIKIDHLELKLHNHFNGINELEAEELKHFLSLKQSLKKEFKKLKQEEEKRFEEQRKLIKEKKAQEKLSQNKLQEKIEDLIQKTQEKTQPKTQNAQGNPNV